jgi:Trk K+ transport system NAD-binding subunit
VLTLTSPATAGVVLVLPRDEPDADAEVVKTLLALRAALAGAENRPPVVAAVRDDRYRLAARLAAGPGGVVLESDTVTARLIAQAARRPGLSLVHQELLDFAGDEFYLVGEASLTGRTFGDALLSYPTSCVVGLVRGDTPLLAPPPQTAIAADDLLIVVSRDDDTAWAGECGQWVDKEVMASGPPTPARPERVLMLGWNRRAPLMVDQLRRRALPGSAVDVVADCAEETVRQVRESGTGPVLTLHQGDATRPETLQRLDVHSYDSVIVLGQDPAPGESADHPDNRTLVTLLLLRRLEEATGRELPVVTELVDDRNRALAPVSPGADVIISGKLIGLLMAQISQNRHLAAVFEELFSADGTGIRLRPADDYVVSGCETAFATVVAAARQRGECALGYRSHAEATAGPGHGVRINPPKAERRRWTAEDEVVVVGRD